MLFKRKSIFCFPGVCHFLPSTLSAHTSHYTSNIHGYIFGKFISLVYLGLDAGPSVTKGEMKKKSKNKTANRHGMSDKISGVRDTTREKSFFLTYAS